MKTEDLEFIYWDKLDPDTKLSDHFKQSEFSCQCNYPECIQQKVSKELLRRLENFRGAAGKPLTVTSGFRCQKHQEDLAKNKVNTVVASKSQHELGTAADVANSSLMVSELMDLAKKVGFESIGYAFNFLHVDLRPKRNDGTLRIWKY